MEDENAVPTQKNAVLALVEPHEMDDVFFVEYFTERILNSYNLFAYGFSKFMQEGYSG